MKIAYGNSRMGIIRMDHTKDEKKIISDYQAAADGDVLDFINEAEGGSAVRKYVTVAFLSGDAAQRIKDLTGKEVDGNRVVLDINALRHIQKRHGKEGQQDHSMCDPNDIARMGYVIMNYDDISYDGKTTTGYTGEFGEPAPLVQISKRIDGTYYVIETASSQKNRKNYVVTAFIGKA